MSTWSTTELYHSVPFAGSVEGARSPEVNVSGCQLVAINSPPSTSLSPSAYRLEVAVLNPAPVKILSGSLKRISPPVACVIEIELLPFTVALTFGIPELLIAVTRVLTVPELTAID